MRRLPAEWEPQSGIMLTWPHADTDWADQLGTVEALYAQLTAIISRYEPVLIVCQDSAHAARVRDLAKQAGARPGRLRLGIAPSNDTWARDHGPITIMGEGGNPILLDFRFNGWGGKFEAGLDDRITSWLHDSGLFGEAPCETVDMTLEGGAIETDGLGTLLAVTRTLVDPKRNPDCERADIERILRGRLGIRYFLWLEHGAISGDDTDGHIDTLARFSDSQTICYARCEDRADPDYRELRAMEQELKELRDPEGRSYRLVPLPVPAPVLSAEGERLPAGYANFLIINGAVLLPIYGDPADEEARAVMTTLFPSRAVLTLDCRPLIRQGGSLHCISMQLPFRTLRAEADPTR